MDAIHDEIDIWNDPIVRLIHEEKYKDRDEATPIESHIRVAEGIYGTDEIRKDWAVQCMTDGLWMPGGRILAGAGTKKIVTLLNCYASRNIPDSMEGIADSLKDAMLTLQQGGGIGMDFSTLRPKGANLVRTGTFASGPVSFMQVWNTMCHTIMSAGSRRGAMMATLRIDHPDILEFIRCKREAGAMTNFNISVLVTKEFMDALAADRDFQTRFHVPRHKGYHSETIAHGGDKGDLYVYDTYKARALWDEILQNTYKFSEPGVIFIDRVNERNNLSYVETISTTNPCGEQPLPPYGCCNLGAINLARIVKAPFRPGCEIDWELLESTVKLGVRFLDNVIDKSIFPLREQHIEEQHKRRIGLGVSGLANMLQQLRIRYGSQDSISVVDRVMERIAKIAYRESIELAEERGSFPAFEALEMREAYIVKQLGLSGQIADHGLRNGVILTIAPTGTTSLYYGNISSGIEPTFAWEVNRKILMADGEYKEVTMQDYGFRLFIESERIYGTATGDPIDGLPDYMITAEDISVEEHLAIQAVCQKWIDASISKTINCPKDMTYEEFKDVYTKAYKCGLKGCTTYRPSETRGAVITKIEEEKKEVEEESKEFSSQAEFIIESRPKELHGTTYKIEWPPSDSSYYIGINNDMNGRPYEIFIHSTSAIYAEWTTALSLMISAIFRRGGDISFVFDELKKVVSSTNSAWVDGKHIQSLVAMIGYTIEKHISRPIIIVPEPITPDLGYLADRYLGQIVTEELDHDEFMITGTIPIGMKSGDTITLAMSGCVRCNSLNTKFSEGCRTCLDCGWSNCS